MAIDHTTNIKCSLAKFYSSSGASKQIAKGSKKCGGRERERTARGMSGKTYKFGEPLC